MSGLLKNLLGGQAPQKPLSAPAEDAGQSPVASGRLRSSLTTCRLC